MNHVMSELDETMLRKSTIVFSPHFDDETLGCGGTLLKKKRAGAEVKIVFMTDSSKSHRHLISGDKLGAIRASEGLAASRILGLKAYDVFSLGFEDGKLSEHLDAATDKAIKILFQQYPEEIFMPYYRDKHPDHVATNRIVAAALHMYGRKAIIYEYPVWFWHHWPWICLPTRRPRGLLLALQHSFVSGVHFLRDFRWSVYIGDVLEGKRAALDQYKSQMTRLIPDPRWLTLSDVSGGDFLECFFQEHEIFHRYSLSG